MERQPAHISLVTMLNAYTTLYYLHVCEGTSTMSTCAIEAIRQTEFPLEHIPKMCARIEASFLEISEETPAVTPHHKKVYAAIERLLIGLRSRLEESKPETETKQ